MSGGKNQVLEVPKAPSPYSAFLTVVKAIRVIGLGHAIRVSIPCKPALASTDAGGHLMKSACLHGKPTLTGALSSISGVSMFAI
jgi:hypothetical protein